MMQNQTSQRATQAYRTAAVAVPPLKAMVMLFDGAITFLQRSIEAYEQKRIEESHNYMLRATAILRGLSHNLDFGVGGGLAERLFKTYHALIMACLRSFGRKDSAVQYRRIIASLTELRDAWKSVAVSTTPVPDSKESVISAAR